MKSGLGIYVPNPDIIIYLANRNPIGFTEQQ